MRSVLFVGQIVETQVWRTRYTITGRKWCWANASDVRDMRRTRRAVSLERFDDVEATRAAELLRRDGYAVDVRADVVSA